MQSLETKGQLKVAAAQRQSHGKFWRNTLKNINKCTFYPDFNFPSGYLDQNYIYSIDKDILNRLNKISSGIPLTRHVILVAALAALLNRYTGNQTITLGQPLNSNYMTLTDYLVFKFNFNDKINFKELLEQTKDVVIKSMEFRDYPISLLEDDFENLSNNNENPFFDIAIESLDQSDLKINENLKCKILFSFLINNEKNHLHVSYNSGIYKYESIQRIVNHFMHFLNNVINFPENELEKISLITQNDKEVLDKINNTKCDFRQNARIETIFFEQVLKRPNDIAVMENDEVLTYKQLENKVNILAQHFLIEGVQREQLVAVILERSTNMMITILAILKAGGAYLPIDPSYPEHRIQYILENSCTKIIITQRQLFKNKKTNCRIFDIEKLNIVNAGEIKKISGNSNNLAYSIYTSGSTGKPKGVLIEHVSVINRINWMQKSYPLNNSDIILQKTPISFDVSVWELFWWFFSGAKIFMLKSGAEREPAQIIETIKKHNITTIHFVPSMLNAFLDYIEEGNVLNKLKSLRKVFVSGEALHVKQVERFRNSLHLKYGTRLINLYGPTEATVDVTHLDCTAMPEMEKVTIGRPIDNTRIYIVDGKLNLLPIGVPGELCIAGVGLARGYHKLTDMTKEKFIIPTYDQNDRWYRTGDLARWLPNGEIEYLGRLDFQVKIRGFRIELSEIEAILLSHEDIVEAVVLSQLIANQYQLIAYVKLRNKVDDEILRQYIAKLLPEYMIPRKIIILDKIPLLNNGKIDRKSLPEPSFFFNEQKYTKPRNNTEKLLLIIIEQVLGQKIGIYDNFFAIGGNSINFVTVLAKARKYNLDFTFQQLFANPTVASISSVIIQEKNISLKQKFKKFELINEKTRSKIFENSEDAYPLSFLQAGLIFQNELTHGAGQYHDIISYIIESSIDLSKFSQAVEILVRRNPIFRTSYNLDDFDDYIQIVHKEVQSPLFCNDLRSLTLEEQEIWYNEWLEKEKSYKFEWKKSGLIRIHIHILSDNIYRYILSQHNSALDGWSITLVHTQLFRIYKVLLLGEVFDDPIIENHIRNYIGLEIQSLKSQQDKEFWLQVLNGATYNHLPKISKTNIVSKFSVIFHEVNITKQLSDSIISLAEKLAVPVKTILMAAHLKVISMISGNSDVLTGYEQSGRPEVEDATKAIGLFLNTVPFRVNINVSNWAELINLVYQTEIGLLPHRRYPMAKMKQDLGTQKPFFDSAFNYTHFYLLKELTKIPEFNLLDIRANSETEFAFRSEFCRHFYTDDIKLSIHYHESAFTKKQVENFSYYYIKIFEQMINNPYIPIINKSLLTLEELNIINELGNKFPKIGNIDLEIQNDDCGVYILDEKNQFVPFGVIGKVYFASKNPNYLLLNSNDISGQTFRSTNLNGYLSLEGELILKDPLLKETFKKPIQSPNKALSFNKIINPLLSETEKKVAEAWAIVLKISKENIAKDDNFFDLGGNSLAAIRVTNLLNGLISIMDLMQNSTLSILAELIDKKITSNKAQLLHEITNNSKNSKIALICFPYAGGNAINFKQFSENIASANSFVQVFAIEMSGHDIINSNDNLLPFNSLVEKISQEIKDKIKLPMMFWGHCVGSAFAIATAKKLLKQSTIKRIFVGAKLLPTASRSRTLARDIKRMPINELKEWIISQTGYKDFQNMNEEQISSLIKIFKHDAYEANQYLADLEEISQSIDIPFTLVVSNDDPLTNDFQTNYLSWNKVFKDISLIELNSGGHYFCRTEPLKTCNSILKFFPIFDK